MIRSTTPADAPALYRICLLTGDAGGDASALHRDPDLLGAVYVGPYLQVAPCLGLAALDDQGEILGYAVGTPDSLAFAAACEATWWPALRRAYPRRTGDGQPSRTAADQRLVDFIHHPPAPDASVAADHPAHLHIDLLPAAQGRGLGRLLMAELLSRLEAAGAPGVHLGVDPTNRAAIAFYEHLGFSRWEADSPERGITLVRRLG